MIRVVNYHPELLIIAHLRAYFVPFYMLRFDVAHPRVAHGQFEVYIDLPAIRLFLLATNTCYLILLGKICFQLKN